MPFVKGKSGNPNGRPPLPEVEELRTALRLVRKKNGNRPLLVHAVEQAYKDNSVLIAILKKILPDKISKDITGEIRGGGTKIVIIRPDSLPIKERIDGNQVETVSR